mmetsp:Transcript_19970/g.29249  ORF Transcript_19970/g.29249 Transcript_19970/m.29249 type:complete len:148 (+) Transcript_19970:157-600(+)
MKSQVLSILFMLNGVFSFSPATTTPFVVRNVHHHHTTSTLFYTKNFERAVECASEYGLCDVEEMSKLADELDEYTDSCLYEKDEDMCIKEVADRKDVSEVLRMMGELQLRSDYIKNANLFVDDVKKDAVNNVRDEFVENVLAEGEDW